MPLWLLYMEKAAGCFLTLAPWLLCRPRSIHTHNTLHTNTHKTQTMCHNTRRHLRHTRIAPKITRMRAHTHTHTHTHKAHTKHNQCVSTPADAYAIHVGLARTVYIHTVNDRTLVIFMPNIPYIYRIYIIIYMVLANPTYTYCSHVHRHAHTHTHAYTHKVHTHTHKHTHARTGSNALNPGRKPTKRSGPPASQLLLLPLL